MELMQWEATIGQRYLTTQIAYAPAAAAEAVSTITKNYLGPDDQRFAQILFTTAYQRYLLPLTDADRSYLKSKGINDPAKEGITSKYDFGAMHLVQPLTGLYCAPTRVYLAGSPPSQSVRYISVGTDQVLVAPNDPAWMLAKAFALQGAAYQMLFVVHPALHFPMDSINAVTKTAVPHTHPLFQLLFPHTTYSLALDNAVLESAASVVNDNAQGTWFDPLTSDAYNLKLLFAAGYTGLDDSCYRGAYPASNYREPALICLPTTKPQPVHSTAYSTWQSAYFTRAFLPFCTSVAKFILGSDKTDSYVVHWARYLHHLVKGFPDETEILDAECLGLTLAIYLWDVSLAHGADHASFGSGLTAPEKFLRIRCAPPTSPKTPSPTSTTQIATGDDLARAAMANEMFFVPWTMAPNLNDTAYAFTDPALAILQVTFHTNLRDVDEDPKLTQFMPLRSSDPSGYAGTIPASIQY